jgi:hypothetical protein
MSKKRKLDDFETLGLSPGQSDEDKETDLDPLSDLEYYAIQEYGEDE